jgi:transposase-like protein
MFRRRRAFTTEFKLEAAQLVGAQGCSLPQANR